MSTAKSLEEKVVEVVRKSRQPPEPAAVVKRMKRIDPDASSVRKAIRSLVDQGKLQVTFDWKIRIR